MIKGTVRESTLIFPAVSSPVARVTLYLADESTLGDLVGTKLLTIPLWILVVKITTARRKPMTAPSREATRASDTDSRQQQALIKEPNLPTLGLVSRCNFGILIRNSMNGNLRCAKISPEVVFSACLLVVWRLVAWGVPSACVRCYNDSLVLLL